MLAGFVTCVFCLGPFVVWAIWRRPGYKRVLLDRPPASDWVATAEAFVDPATGEVAQVWTHSASGERAYVRRDRAVRAG